MRRRNYNGNYNTLARKWNYVSRQFKLHVGCERSTQQNCSLQVSKKCPGIYSYLAWSLVSLNQLFKL